MVTGVGGAAGAAGAADGGAAEATILLAGESSLWSEMIVASAAFRFLVEGGMVAAQKCVRGSTDRRVLGVDEADECRGDARRAPKGNAGDNERGSHLEGLLLQGP